MPAAPALHVPALLVLLGLLGCGAYTVGRVASAPTHPAKVAHHNANIANIAPLEAILLRLGPSTGPFCSWHPRPATNWPATSTRRNALPCLPCRMPAANTSPWPATGGGYPSRSRTRPRRRGRQTPATCTPGATTAPAALPCSASRSPDSTGPKGQSARCTLRHQLGSQQDSGNACFARRAQVTVQAARNRRRQLRVASARLRAPGRSAVQGWAAGAGQQERISLLAAGAAAPLRIRPPACKRGEEKGRGPPLLQVTMRASSPSCGHGPRAPT
jgi:hypothetical protein